MIFIGIYYAFNFLIFVFSLLLLWRYCTIISRPGLEWSTSSINLVKKTSFGIESLKGALVSKQLNNIRLDKLSRIYMFLLHILWIKIQARIYLFKMFSTNERFVLPIFFLCLRLYASTVAFWKKEKKQIWKSLISVLYYLMLLILHKFLELWK